MHRVLLFRPQPIGRQEGVIAAQPIEGADATIDGGDHLPLAIETLARRDLMPDPEDRARGLLQSKHALGVFQRNPPAALSQRFGEDLVILDDRSPFEQMLLRVPQRGGGRLEAEALPFPRGLERLLPELGQGLRLLGREPGELTLLDLGGRDLDQLVRSGFPDQDGHFVVGRAAARLLRERLDGLIPLLAALTVRAEQVLRDASNLKPHVTAPRIVPVVNVVPEPAHLVGERIPVDLGQVRALGVDVRRLQRLPASLGPVVRQIAGHRMRVELRIELATGVVVIDGEHQVPGDAILVGAVHPHTRRRRGLQFLQGRLDRVLMRLHEPVILAECGHDRDRLGGREGEVVQMPPPALDLAVHRHAVRALPGPQPARRSRDGGPAESPRTAAP